MAIPAEALCFLSLTELSAMLGRREVASVEATHAVLDRIHKLNPTLRAYLTVLDDSALRQAEAADKEIAAGKWRGPASWCAGGRQGSLLDERHSNHLREQGAPRLAARFECHCGRSLRSCRCRTARQASSD